MAGSLFLAPALEISPVQIIIRPLTISGYSQIWGEDRERLVVSWSIQFLADLMPRQHLAGRSVEGKASCERCCCCLFGFIFFFPW